MVKPRSSCLARFLSNFTLGFSDGLTVPFALTAGLSSLGRADTVIYAGLAELCAGSISMGIGGYLSAVDDEELAAMLLHDGSPSATSTSSESSARASTADEEKGLDELLVRRHLDPLALPAETVSHILAALRRHPDGLGRAAHQLEQRQRPRGGPSLAPGNPPTPWPVAAGLSISLGYSVGGIIPLFPYFFAPTVGIGLGWSISLCLIALMGFGFGKSWLLRGRDSTWRSCLLQGFQMLILGSLAAGASVVCVSLLGGGGHDGPAG